MMTEKEWVFEWTIFKDNSEFLFKEWVKPYTFNDFKDKTVLDCGCGAGEHMKMIAPYARKIVGIDLSTADIARKNCKEFKNIKILKEDISHFSPKYQFDIVYSLGVLHHMTNPSCGFNNIKKLVKKKGKLIIFVYSWEGNSINRIILEPLKYIFFLRIEKHRLLKISRIITLLMYIPIYSIYQLPLKVLPFYYYFQNFRKLSFERNVLNVFDKLNAHRTNFIKEEEVAKWFNSEEFSNVSIRYYNKVCWCASGIKK